MGVGDGESLALPVPPADPAPAWRRGPAARGRARRRRGRRGALRSPLAGAAPRGVARVPGRPGGGGHRPGGVPRRARPAGPVRPAPPLAPWLHRIAVNRAIDHVRARAARREVGATTVAEDVAAGGGVDPAADAALADEITAALAVLPRTSAPSSCCATSWAAPGEIAAMLDLPRGTVNSRLRRALDALAEGLERVSDDLRRRPRERPVPRRRRGAARPDASAGAGAVGPAPRHRRSPPCSSSEARSRRRNAGGRGGGGAAAGRLARAAPGGRRPSGRLPAAALLVQEGAPGRRPRGDRSVWATRTWSPRLPRRLSGSRLTPLPGGELGVRSPRLGRSTRALLLDGYRIAYVRRGEARSRRCSAIAAPPPRAPSHPPRPGPHAQVRRATAASSSGRDGGAARGGGRRCTRARPGGPARGSRVAPRRIAICPGARRPRVISGRAAHAWRAAYARAPAIRSRTSCAPAGARPSSSAGRSSAPAAASALAWSSDARWLMLYARDAGQDAVPDGAGRGSSAIPAGASTGGRPACEASLTPVDAVSAA